MIRVVSVTGALGVVVGCGFGCGSSGGTPPPLGSTLGDAGGGSASDAGSDALADGNAQADAAGSSDAGGEGGATLGPSCDVTSFANREVISFAGGVPAGWTVSQGGGGAVDVQPCPGGVVGSCLHAKFVDTDGSARARIRRDYSVGTPQKIRQCFFMYVDVPTPAAGTFPWLRVSSFEFDSSLSTRLDLFPKNVAGGDWLLEGRAASQGTIREADWTTATPPQKRWQQIVLDASYTNTSSTAVVLRVDADERSSDPATLFVWNRPTATFSIGLDGLKAEGEAWFYDPRVAWQ